MTDLEVRTVDAMLKSGGGFVKALSECFRRADDSNFRRLRAAFPDYWNQYEARAIQLRDAES